MKVEASEAASQFSEIDIYFPCTLYLLYSMAAVVRSQPGYITYVVPPVRQLGIGST